MTQSRARRLEHGHDDSPPTDRGTRVTTRRTARAAARAPVRRAADHSTRSSTGRRPAEPRAAALARAGLRPAWARPALLGLLLATALLYTWNLTSSGWANSFYSAAVQAGSESWKAFFFGSSDAAQLDHRRQAAGLAVGHGAVGAAPRPQLLRDPPSRGAHGRRDRRGRLRDREAALRCGCRPHRRRGPRADPGRRADVQLQQPRRAADPAHGAGRLGDDEAPSSRPRRSG